MKKGFTLLFGVLITGFLLTVALSILAFSVRQVSISGLGRESQIAFYASDSLVECVRYYDEQGLFSQQSNVPSNISCNGRAFPITVQSGTFSCPGDSFCPETPILGEQYFKITFGQNTIVNNARPSAQAVLVKQVVPEGNGQSTLTVDGRNTSQTNARQVERTLKTTYLPKQGCIRGADVYIVVDNSESIGSTNMVTLRNKMKELIDGLLPSNTEDKDNRVGLVGYANHATQFTALGDRTKKGQLEQAVDQMVSGGGTNIPVGLRYAYYGFANLMENGLTSPGEGNVRVGNLKSNFGSYPSTSFGPFDTSIGVNSSFGGNRTEKRNVVVLITDGGNRGNINSTNCESGNCTLSQSGYVGGYLKSVDTAVSPTSPGYCSSESERDNPNCYRRNELQSVVTEVNLLKSLPQEGTGLNRKPTEVYTVYVDAGNDEFRNCRVSSSGYRNSWTCGEFMRSEVATSRQHHNTFDSFDITEFINLMACSNP